MEDFDKEELFVGSEANQPVPSGAVTQDDKNNAAIVQGLVLATGVLGIIPILSTIGWLAAVGVIVLYFVWKDKSDFVKGHLRQALGLMLVWVAVGIVLMIVGMIIGAMVIGAMMRGSFGALAGLTTLMTVVGLVINLGIGALGLMGLLAAQKGEAYEYPVVGKFISNFGQKKAA